MTGCSRTQATDPMRRVYFNNNWSQEHTMQQFVGRGVALCYKGALSRLSSSYRSSVKTDQSRAVTSPERLCTFQGLVSAAKPLPLMVSMADCTDEAKDSVKIEKV
jgi:hypothetical protein